MGAQFLSSAGLGFASAGLKSVSHKFLLCMVGGARKKLIQSLEAKSFFSSKRNWENRPHIVDILECQGLTLKGNTLNCGVPILGSDASCVESVLCASQHSLRRWHGSCSGFGSCKTVPIVPVLISVPGRSLKRVPMVPVSGSGAVPAPSCRNWFWIQSQQPWNPNLLK